MLQDNRAFKNVDTSSIAAILTVLEIVSDQLGGIAKDVEQSVIGVCNGFQGMSQRARAALSKSADALDTSGEDGGLPAFIHRVRLSLATMLCRVESANEFNTHLTDQFAVIDDRLSQILRLSEKMNMVAYDAANVTQRHRIESRTVGGNPPSGSQLCETVETMGSSMSQYFHAIHELVADLRNIIKDETSRARVKADEDKQSVITNENTIRNMLDKMSAAYEKMNSSLSSSAAMTRQLNSDIGQAVMSMQFQDRVNQRIEHIVSTIDELSFDLQPLMSASTPETIAMITELWRMRLAEKSTMEAERRSGGVSAPSEETSSIDLF